MESVCRTIWGSNLQTCQLLGIPYTVNEFTTLNEKFNIQNNIAIGTNIYPRVKYFCIGNGGHQMTVGADGIALAKNYQHRSTDASLFKHLPFVLRPYDNDIAAAERARYALRKEVTYDGVRHVAYYLRRIDMSAVTSQLDYRTILNGVVKSTPYTPVSECLNPIPIELANTGVNTVNSDYITSSALIDISFSDNDIVELLNAANVIYGDENYAIISEIGLCSGVDKTINVTASNGGVFNFNEAIAVQIASFISSMHIAKSTDAGISKFLDIGCNESVYQII